MLLDTLVVRSLLVPALVVRHRPTRLVAEPARGQAGPSRTHRPHGLRPSRAWSTSVSPVSPPPVRASTPRSSRPPGLTSPPSPRPTPSASSRPRAAFPDAGSCPTSTPCWRSTTSTSSCWPRRAGVHAEQARAVVEAGLPVVVDKPLGRRRHVRRSPSSTPRRQAGVPLTVFQNRRYDAGARDHARRGPLRTARARCSGPRCAGNAGGPRPRTAGARTRRRPRAAASCSTCRPTLVDAAVDLFGPIETVYAQVFCRTTTSEDDAFLACRHESGVGQPPRHHLGGGGPRAPHPRARPTGRVHPQRVRARPRHLPRPAHGRRPLRLGLRR